MLLRRHLVAILGNIWNWSSLIDLHQSDFRVQIKAHKESYGSDDFHADLAKIQRGDVIACVNGFPNKTKAGELSLVPKKIHILSPVLKTLATSALSESSFKNRHRHVALMLNPQVRSMFHSRSKIVQAIRDYLHKKEFIEVETPILDIGASGASADPFKTHHKEMDWDMYVRIATEIRLKECVIGGLEKVFEIGKQFRNEGVDRTHNPEFTSLEFYMAYADYFDIMDMAEDLLSFIAQQTGLAHYSKSQIFVQKFNFDKKNPTFSRVFPPKFFFDNFSREIKVVNS